MTVILAVSGDCAFLASLHETAAGSVTEVLEARDAFSAIETLVALKKKGAKAGSVLIDSNLPDVDGGLFCEILEVLWPGIPLIRRTLEKPLGKSDLQDLLAGPAAAAFSIGFQDPVWKPPPLHGKALVLVRLEESADLKMAFDALGAVAGVKRWGPVGGEYGAALFLDVGYSIDIGETVEKKMSALLAVDSFDFIPFEAVQVSEAAALLLGGFEKLTDQKMQQEDTKEIPPLQKTALIESWVVLEVEKPSFDRLFTAASLMEEVMECYPDAAGSRIVMLAASDSFKKIERMACEKLGKMAGVLRVRTYNLI